MRKETATILLRSLPIKCFILFYFVLRRPGSLFFPSYIRQQRICDQVPTLRLNGLINVIG